MPSKIVYSPPQVEIRVANDAKSPQLARLESPLKQGNARIVWTRVAIVAGMHALAALALVPWLFSWTGVVLACIGYYVFGVLGINLCYHRLLTHRSFKCPKWFEHTLAVLGVCCLQDGPSRWVALHRIHHQYSDEEQDPHSPLVSFLWAHFEWVLTEDKRRSWILTYDKYAPDMIRDYFYLFLERKDTWLVIYALHAALIFVIGLAVGWLVPGGSALAGLQFGASLLVWGVFLRTVCVWHATWSVNSFTHLSGYRNYETSDGSRNNWLVSIISGGEGWHNNHHADQNCAAAGHRWWEFDLTFLIIRAAGASRLGFRYRATAHCQNASFLRSANSCPTGTTPSCLILVAQAIENATNRRHGCEIVGRLLR